MPGQIFPTSTRWDTPPAGATALCWTPPWRWPPSPPCSPCLAQSSRWLWWRWWWQVRLWWWRWWWQLWLWGWQWRSSHVRHAQLPSTEFTFQSLSMRLLTVNISMIYRLCLEGRKDQPWFSMDLPPSHNLSGDTTIAQISPVHQHRYHHLQHHYRNLDKAPRLSIRIDIWILLSDTDTICH